MIETARAGVRDIGYAQEGFHWQTAQAECLVHAQSADIALGVDSSGNKDEGAGEVQTPLLGPAADGLRIGDRVWFRHAKAGELCERFNDLHLIDGDAVTATVPTYRGEGKAFL